MYSGLVSFTASTYQRLAPIDRERERAGERECVHMSAVHIDLLSLGYNKTLYFVYVFICCEYVYILLTK